MSLDGERKKVQGTGVASNGTVDVTILAAPGAGKVLRLKRACLAVTVAAVGGGGEAALEDGAGGTRIFVLDADAVAGALINIDFGEDGYDLTANTVLNLTVDGAVTTQATARCSAVGVVLG